MKLEFHNNKFMMVWEDVNYNELKAMQPLPAMLVEYDILDRYKHLMFTLVDGGLYGYTENEWFYFDPSVRRWSECDKPEPSITNLMAMKCDCQGKDPIKHSHYDKPPHRCARCTECSGHSALKKK